jgi:hypothetical protein
MRDPVIGKRMQSATPPTANIDVINELARGRVTHAATPRYTSVATTTVRKDKRPTLINEMVLRNRVRLSF